MPLNNPFDKSYLKTGDILVRLGSIRVYGLPIEKLIAYATHSKYSHASIVVVIDGEPIIYEVNDKGTEKLTFEEWLSYVSTAWAVYRLPLSVEETRIIEKEILNQLELDKPYDWTFSDPSLYYCVESVVNILEKANLIVPPPLTPKEVLAPWAYKVFHPLNKLASFTGKCFSEGWGQLAPKLEELGK